MWRSSGDYPQSPSWAEAIPAHQYNLWPTEIEAGLKAATAPLIEVAFLDEQARERNALHPTARAS